MRAKGRSCCAVGSRGADTMRGLHASRAQTCEARDGGWDFEVVSNRAPFAHADYLSMIIRNAREVEQTALGAGLTATQFRILYRLTTHHGAMRVGVLADALDLGASAVCGALAQLDAAGAITRVDDVSDKRGVHAIIAPYGNVLLERCFLALRPVLANLYAEAPVDLRSYVAACTLRVARSNALFGDDDAFEDVQSALCDEILLTSALANRVAHDEGLSLTEYRILLELLPRTEGVRPNEIARRLGLRRNGVAAAQSELQRRGLVMRHRDILDRRAAIVELTSDGYAVLRHAALAMSEALDYEIMPGITQNDLEIHRQLASSVQEARLG